MATKLLVDMRDMTDALRTAKPSAERWRIGNADATPNELGSGRRQGAVCGAAHASAMVSASARAFTAISGIPTRELGRGGWRRVRTAVTN